MKIGDRVFVHGYIDEIRKDCVIVRNRGGYFGTEKCEVIQGDLVRCKDCKHRYMDGEVTHFYWCRLHDRPVDDTDFCAWGEESGVE